MLSFKVSFAMMENIIISDKRLNRIDELWHSHYPQYHELALMIAVIQLLKHLLYKSSYRPGQEAPPVL
jgi:hypothetical protein